MRISSTASSLFPQNNSSVAVFIYLLSWTQKLPKAVDPILEYRIQWKRLNTDSTTDGSPTVSPWLEDTMKISSTIKLGTLITYQMRDLESGRYQVKVTPRTIFGYGDSAQRFIDAKKKRGPQTTLRGPSFFCDFSNQEMCSFVQERSRSLLINDKELSLQRTDEFDWQWNSNSSLARRSKDTGPEYDHTTMSKEGGYMYIEASKTRKGDRARLVSPTFYDDKSTRQCLRFFYHMRGRDIGLLRLLMRSQTGREENLWEKQNEQGSDWMSVSIPLTPSLPYQFIFEALMLSDGYLGDIAIDDIILTDGPCPTPPTLAHGTTSRKLASIGDANGAFIPGSLLMRVFEPIFSFSIEFVVTKDKKTEMFLWKTISFCSINKLSIFIMLFFHRIIMKVIIGR